MKWKIRWENFNETFEHLIMTKDIVKVAKNICHLINYIFHYFRNMKEWKKVFITSKTDREQTIKLSQRVDDGYSTKLFKKLNDKTHGSALKHRQCDGHFGRMTSCHLLDLFRIALKRLKYLYFYQ